MMQNAPVCSCAKHKGNIYIYKYTHTSPLRDPDDHTEAPSSMRDTASPAAQPRPSASKHSTLDHRLCKGITVPLSHSHSCTLSSNVSYI